MLTRGTLFVFVVTLLLVVASSGFARFAFDADEGEQPTAFSKLPDVVKATVLAEILREVDGLEVEDATREVEGGRTVYEVEFEFGEKEVELEIDDNGRLLEKEVELEHEDDGDDEDEDNEDNEEDNEDERGRDR